MKRSKVIFVNKSKKVLYAQCRKAGSSDPDNFMVVKSKSIRLFPGQYEIMVYYESGAVLISSKSIDSMVISEVSAPGHSKFTAKHIRINLPERNTRMIFREQISVGSILDGSARMGF
jgi:hypothetical protein